jgi:hypothetical protein
MLNYFGKKKVSADALAPLYVNTIYSAIDQGFPVIAEYLNDEKEFIRPPGIHRVNDEWFIYIVYAGNLLNLHQHFSPEQVGNLTRIFSIEITRMMGKDPEIDDQIIYDYLEFLKNLNDKEKNLPRAMALAIFHKYGLNAYQQEHFQKLNAPSPNIMKDLQEMGALFIWNWEDYLSKFKII